MGLLEIKSVSINFNGKRILDNLTMDIWKGHIHAVVGPNGAGKSTLASTIMGLPGYREHEGDILFNGSSIKNLAVDERARLGITLAWQEPARFEGLTVNTYISSAAKNKEEDAIIDYLNKVGLDKTYMKRAVDKTLSGGERKKLELASIIAMEPRLVLMDEPDSGIDVDSLKKIFTVLSVFKESGTTVILITHSPTVLEQAEHAFLLCCGKIIRKGVIKDIMPYFTSQCVPCDHQNEPIFTEEEEVVS